MTSVRVNLSDQQGEVPVHRHRQGQLVLSLKGGVTCEVPSAVWMVPPRCAVWIPSQMPHSVRATANARILYLFIQPDAASMPAECCTLSISPLVRELSLHLADQPRDYLPDNSTGRAARVLLDQLMQMPVERLFLPISNEPRIRRIAHELSNDPADRRTLEEWGDALAMSGRSLARLVSKETGLTFGRWRQQFHLIVAMRQLAEGRSVQRVAEELGYESVTAFITMFKKAVGKPPGRYFAQLSRADES